MFRQSTHLPTTRSSSGLPDVSIVIVTFNARSITLETLTSYLIAIAADTTHEYEIVVVDNASSDGVPTSIRNEFPDVKLTCNSENLGFAAACNIGLEQTSARYVLFSNPDIEVNKQTLPELVSYMEEHPRAGACTPRLQLMGMRDLDWGCHRGLPTPWASLTYFSHLDRLFRHSRRLAKVFGRYHLLDRDLSVEHPVEVIEGGFFFARREAIEAAGGWDDDYFLFGEDIDLCYRILRCGYGIQYVPRALAWHYLGAATGLKDNDARVDEATRRRSYDAFYDSMKVFYDKHYQHRYGRWVRRAVFLGIDGKKMLGRRKRRVGLPSRGGSAPIPKQPAIYNAIRVYGAVRSHRLKFLGVLAARTLGVRHLSIRFDPVVACNIECLMCPYSDPARRREPNLRFTVDEMERLASMLFPSALQVVVGCSYEPMMHNDFLRAVRLAKEHGVPQVSFTTNGQLMTEGDLEDLCELGLNELILSTHGVSKESYERLMVNASYSRFHESLAAVRAVSRRRGVSAPTLRMNYTVNTENLYELRRFFEVYGEYPIRTLQIRPMYGDANGVSKLSAADLPVYNEILRGLALESRSRGITLLANVADPRHERTNYNALAFPAFFLYVDPKSVWREDFDWRKESYHEFCRRIRFSRYLMRSVLAHRDELVHSARRYSDSAGYEVL